MKKLLLAAIYAGLLSTVVGCGIKNDNTSATSNTDTNINSEGITQTEDITEATETEIKIVHSKGETTVKTNPSKIVVFDMGILDIIDSLDIEVELAVPVASVPEYLSEYANAANAGGIKEPDLEAIFAFEPEVIFISGRQSDYYEELNKIAPTVFVDLNAATYMEDFENNVKNLGTIFGKTKQADEKLLEIETYIANTKDLIAASDEKALIVLVNDGNISAYGSGSRFGIIHDVLGVAQADENIEVSTHGQSASYEYIADVNPDILFVVDRTVVAGGTASVTDTLNNELVNGTNAAKNNKVINLDPEAWYLSGGGIASVSVMIDDISKAFIIE